MSNKIILSQISNQILKIYYIKKHIKIFSHYNQSKDQILDKNSN